MLFHFTFQFLGETRKKIEMPLSINVLDFKNCMTPQGSYNKLYQILCFLHSTDACFSCFAVGIRVMFILLKAVECSLFRFLFCFLFPQITATWLPKSNQDLVYVFFFTENIYGGSLVTSFYISLYSYVAIHSLNRYSKMWSCRAYFSSTTIRV